MLGVDEFYQILRHCDFPTRVNLCEVLGWDVIKATKPRKLSQEKFQGIEVEPIEEGLLPDIGYVYTSKFFFSTCGYGQSISRKTGSFIYEDGQRITSRYQFESRDRITWKKVECSYSEWVEEES